MTPLEHLVTLLLCTFAAWGTIGAIRRTTATDPGTTRLKLAALIAGPPLLLLTVGVPFLTVIGYYLAGFLLIYGLIYGLPFALSLHRYGLTNMLRSLGHTTPPSETDQPPRRGQQQRGPQPPRRAIQLDPEYAYNWHAPFTFEDGRIVDVDFGRAKRMKNALSEDELRQLRLFRQWQDETGQNQYADPNMGQQEHPQHLPEHLRQQRGGQEQEQERETGQPPDRPPQVFRDQFDDT